MSKAGMVHSAEEPAENWDLFISHASEDKQTFVEPLASALSAFGVNVWYDRYTLKLGDSLSRSIDKGLAKSDFGLVVLSPAFISKKWPEYELRGLTAREQAGGKIILPIWHDISFEELLKFSPPLADKFAIKSSGSTPIAIAAEVIRAIRPDIFTRIMRRIAFYHSLDVSEIKSFDPKELISPPIQHSKLPSELVGRIRLVRACLLDTYPHSMAFWIDGFKRDAHPSKEICWWEHFAAVYNEYRAMTPSLTGEQKSKLFALIFKLSNAANDATLEDDAKDLPGQALEIVRNLYEHVEPAYDLPEDLPTHPKADPGTDMPNLHGLDMEHFPKDLPEDLVRSLMRVTKPKKSSDRRRNKRTRMK
jgi:hypothetical protein